MSNFTERDLHVHVYGQLDSSRRLPLNVHFARDPGAAEGPRVWRKRDKAPRALCSQLLDQRMRRRRWCSFALVAGAIVLGFWLGRMAHPYGMQRFGEAAALPHRAAIAYAVYAPEVRHPVEIGANHRDNLVKWLSERLGKDLKLPSLTPHGFELVGGRLLPGDKGPAAQFMYQDAKGDRITLYESPSDRSAEPESSALRFSQDDKVAVFYWSDRTFGYALSGEVDRARLLAVATAAYLQLKALDQTSRSESERADVVPHSLDASGACSSFAEYVLTRAARV